MYLAGIREKIWQPLYDSADVATLATQATFFNTPASGTKQLDQTNLRQAGQLPAPYEYLVKGFWINLPPDVDEADAQALLTDSVFEFFINTKPYLQIPCRKLGGGNAPWIAASITGTGLQRVAQYSAGPPDARNFFPIELGVKVAQLENFRVTITFPGGITLGSTRRVKVFLGGILKRSVQ